MTANNGEGGGNLVVEGFEEFCKDVHGQGEPQGFLVAVFPCSARREMGGKDALHMERMLYIDAAMKEDIESAQTPRGITTKTPKWIPAWGIVTLIVTILSRRWLSNHMAADVVVRAVVALAPIIFWFIWARATEKRIRLLDEMQRMMVYEASFFAGIGTMFVMMALAQAELTRGLLPEWLNHGLNYQGAFLLMCFLLLVGFFRSKRRLE